MAKQTTKQPKRNKKQKEGRVRPSGLKKIKLATKSALAFMLVRPLILRFLMVHVPDWAEKVEQLLKVITSFFNDLH